MGYVITYLLTSGHSSGNAFAPLLERNWWRRWAHLVGPSFSLSGISRVENKWVTQFLGWWNMSAGGCRVDGLFKPSCRVKSRFYSWWLNQPKLKNTRQNGFIFPKVRDEPIKNCLSCHHPSNFPGKYTWKSSARKTLTKHGFYWFLFLSGFPTPQKPSPWKPPTCTPVPRWATRFAGLRYWTHYPGPQLSEVGETHWEFLVQTKNRKNGWYWWWKTSIMYKGFWKIPADAGVFPINSVMMLMHSKLWKIRTLRYPTGPSNLGLKVALNFAYRKFRQLRLQT